MDIGEIKVPIRIVAMVGLIAQEGKTGRSTNYRLVRKPDINPTNPTLCWLTRKATR